VPVEPALEFAADDAQISVAVLVGDVVSEAQLAIAWSWLDGPDGEQPLFEHEIEVAGGDVAYSHGVATGPLAAGTYQATVTLGDATTEARFAVRQMPIEFPTANASGLRRAMSEEPAPPSSGRSGSIPSPSESGPSSVCQPWVQATSSHAMTGANGCGDSRLPSGQRNLLEVTAWVGDNPPVAFGQARGDFIKPVRADPCDLGGSDLETEPVSYAVTVISGPDEGTLFRKRGPAPEADETAPMAFLSSEPSPGSQVSAGEVIAIEIIADDHSSSESIVTGIASVMLTTDTGQQIDGWEFEGPVACDKDRLRRVVRLEYRVPESPLEIVRLVATIRDYAGHEVSLQAYYPTVGLWTGYMDVSGGYSLHDVTGTFSCTSEWEFRVVAFASASGELDGYAEGIPEPAECDPLWGDDQLGFSRENTRLGITGTITPDQLTLHFDIRSMGWHGIVALYRPPVPDIVLTRLGSSGAAGDISLRLPTNHGTYWEEDYLTGLIDLGCDDC
jgi:hypothetical protein